MRRTALHLFLSATKQMHQTPKQDQQKLDERHHTHTLKYPPTSDAQGGACKGKGVGCTFAISTRKYPSFTTMEICRWESVFGVAAVLGTVQVKVCRCQRISKQDPQARRGNKKRKQEEHFVLTGFRIYVLCFRGSDPLYIYIYYIYRIFAISQAFQRHML